MLMACVLMIQVFVPLILLKTTENIAFCHCISKIYGSLLLYRQGRRDRKVFWKWYWPSFLRKFMMLWCTYRIRYNRLANDPRVHNLKCQLEIYQVVKSTWLNAHAFERWGTINDTARSKEQSSLPQHGIMDKAIISESPLPTKLCRKSRMRTGGWWLTIDPWTGQRLAHELVFVSQWQRKTTISTVEHGEGKT